jgi:cytochrome d ubiquinol oxidase subunit I
MQHPVGYTLVNGRLNISNWGEVMTNPWILPQYLHAMSGAVVTGAFMMTGLGAFYLLSRRDIDYGRMFVTLGVIVGFLASCFQLYPSGDMEGLQVTKHQPTKLAAMEGLFQTQSGAGIIILGQPDVTTGRIDNPIIVPNVLSFLTYRRWTAVVQGLNSFPPNDRPDTIEMLYYAYHIMVGLGTIFIAITALALLLLWRRKLFQSRWMLWILMLATPFPYIANTAGWFTTELGRQPWVAFGLLRTVNGSSPLLTAGNIIFTLLGFAGMYLFLGLLYVLMVVFEAMKGPLATEKEAPSGEAEDVGLMSEQA